MVASLANLVLLAALVLSGLFVGSYFFISDPDLQANLGLFGITYISFIWPAYFVLRITERRPIPTTTAPPADIEALRTQRTTIQKEILRDINKYVYLKETHMQDQLHALGLGVKSDTELPKLIGYHETDQDGRYALVLQFDSHHVPLAKWQKRQAKLDTFFGKDVTTAVTTVAPERVELALICKRAKIDEQAAN
ncbi:DUF2854 domain-containing protein [Candidatus Cyanaurora vandensis]|uniref:DUF2854 domain-containing protein n=1 Tax=Candidatus Cyanaurora vandensis TaxID=2714958 RepID=UPI00257A7973|nr:DUF2854 domain-containing protein [Candidatus Cyanaurora vandensis]